MARPVSVTCHYLNEARFGPAELEVTSLPATTRAVSLLVKMTQDAQDVLVALVSALRSGSSVPTSSGRRPPEAPAPDEIEDTILDEDVFEIMGDEPFWKNLEFRIIKGLMGRTTTPPSRG